MQNYFKTFDYFKSSSLDIFFALPEILSDSSHTEYENLKSDVDNINLEDLKRYVEENKIDTLLGRHEDKHLGRCSFYLIYKIQAEIVKERLEILANTAIKTAPYNSENLSDITLQKNNLVYTKDLTPYSGGFKYKDYVYNSCYA